MCSYVHAMAPQCKNQTQPLYDTRFPTKIIQPKMHSHTNTHIQTHTYRQRRLPFQQKIQYILVYALQFLNFENNISLRIHFKTFSNHARSIGWSLHLEITHFSHAKIDFKYFLILILIFVFKFLFLFVFVILWTFQNRKIHTKFSLFRHNAICIAIPIRTYVCTYFRLDARSVFIFVFVVFFLRYNLLANIIAAQHSRRHSL